jgi:threonine dehydrogenase-like Zn-dependent dehydrogenase
MKDFIIMRAFHITGPKQGAVVELPNPVASAGEVLISVERVGICGTDVEFFNGDMAYLHSGHAKYPMQIGHEWCGTVVDVGTGVAKSWLGKRVTGDTMLGCQKCNRCTTGYQYLCEDRNEIGIRNGYAGALAELLVVPEFALHQIPDHMDATLGALVEPGGNALRSVQSAQLKPGERILIFGPGTIGLLCALFAVEAGYEVHLAGRMGRSLDYAREFAARKNITGVWALDEIPHLPFHGVIDATFATEIPARALELLEPGRRVVYIGISGEPSTIDTRTLVLKDITAVGILSASPGLAGTIEKYEAGVVNPSEIVAAVIGLDGVAAALAGIRPADASAGPKIHIDPRPAQAGHSAINSAMLQQLK